MQRMLGVRRDSDGPIRATLAADGLEAHNQAARSIMRCVSVAVAAGLLSFPAFAAYSQEHAHSQGAPTEKLGAVHFATSCSPGVAPQFDRAVALLHPFESGESTRGFNEVLPADSTCAMAYWGIALSRWSNPMAAGNRSVAQLQQGQQAVDAAMRLGDHASERERLHTRRRAAVRRFRAQGSAGARRRVCECDERSRDAPTGGHRSHDLLRDL